MTKKEITKQGEEFYSFMKSQTEQIAELKEKLAKSEAEVEFYKNSMNNLVEDFKDIENRLRGHLSAETKLRVKLQADKQELLDKVNNYSDVVFDFADEVVRMRALYNNQKYSLAEKLRDELSEKLDDLMRGIE